MALFGFGKGDKTPPPPTTPSDSIETVREHLEAIGKSRLRVRSAGMKVLLTQIAWHGEEYLIATSAGGQPSGGQIVELCRQLELVRKVADSFVLLEGSPNDTDEYHLQYNQAVTAVQDFVVAIRGKLSKTQSSGAGVGFDVDTELLRRLAKQIQ